MGARSFTLCGVVMIAGCGRLGFEPGGTDGSADGNVDSIAADACTFGPFSSPVRLDAALQAVDDDWFPTPAAGETILAWYSYRPPSAGADLWFATRQSQAVTFGAPQRILELATADDEMTPALAEDGLEIVWAIRTATVATNLYRSTRTSTTESWGVPVELATVNATSADYMPWLSRDGHELWFSSARPGIGRLDLWVAERADRASPFGTPQHVPELDSPSDDGAPTTNADGLEIFFTSDRPGGPGLLDVYTARRPALDQPWSTPTVVLELSSPRDEFGLRLSADGAAMYLNYDTLTTGGGAADMWRATRTCL